MTACASVYSTDFVILCRMGVSLVCMYIGCTYIEIERNQIIEKRQIAKVFSSDGVPIQNNNTAKSNCKKYLKCTKVISMQRQ